MNLTPGNHYPILCLLNAGVPSSIPDDYKGYCFVYVNGDGINYRLDIVNLETGKCDVERMVNLSGRSPLDIDAAVNRINELGFYSVKVSEK